MSTTHNVTLQMYDLIISLQKAVNAALTFPSELTITQAVINLESTREALQLLIEACKQSEGAQIEADDLNNLITVINDTTEIMQQAVADLQPLIAQLIDKANN
ncbi:hypothetical protein ACNEV0_001459 [Escherichia coli]|jgi:hypothetical protein|uniref:hypothetical protein n=1 Tax=Escherichia TaxID=561 RepID=UPI00025C8B5B|nr:MULTISPECIES: hypothetical protein [Escherichia]EEY7557343.1 hypothetical protein [Escherichia coli O2]ART18135.1 hypothetical protein EC95JB1_02141 [Escherichia coli]ART25915.1 hypothetical protein EC95NR1_02137 [Escherichia coli]EEC7280032.1 hypothetical protein [Escherichia coli]EEC9123141.1 hypothetical protein [Escherichia coli]